MAFDFGRDRKVRRHAEFVRAQRLGRRVGTPHFTFLVSAQPRSPDANRASCASTQNQACASTQNQAGVSTQNQAGVSTQNQARLGLVVARKIGAAVRRNRVKRLCRECFRLWPELLPDGVDLIIIARPGADELGLSEVQAEWRAVEPLLKRRAEEALARAACPDHPPADGT